jgi:hypothetical protein
MRLFSAIAASCALAACITTPAERIADTLMGYGLDRTRAECVGGRLQSELSTKQLLELGRAARAYRQSDPNPGRLGLDDLLRVSSEIRDPAIPLTIARSAGRCGLVPMGFTNMVNALTA